MTNSEKRIDFITRLRAISTIFILMCHLTTHCSIGLIAMTSQFFNIGVDIFFIISGFLFGLKNDISSPVKWYLKRIKRIFIPYEIFVIILLIIHLIKGIFSFTVDWVLLIFGMQGSVVNVLGAEQTWFITPLLICYLFTPILAKLTDKLDSKVKKALFISVLIVLPIILSLFESPAVKTLLAPLSCYSLAYLLGKNFDKVSSYPPEKPFRRLLLFC